MLLIVDEDREEASQIQHLVGGEMASLTATSREDALDLLKRYPVNVTILSLGAVPDETYDLVQGLLDQELGIPILLIADPRQLIEAAPLIREGIITAMERPLNLSELRSKLNALIPTEETGHRQDQEESGPAATPERQDISGAPARNTSLLFDPVSVDQLITVLAHRLKNPLVAIRTFTQLLQDRFNDLQFQKDFYQVTRHEVEKMDGLIDQIIEFSELPDPLFERHPILPAVEAAVKTATHRLKGKRIDLASALSEKDLALPMDREQFIYALTYLLTSLSGTAEKGGHTGMSVKILEAESPEGVEIQIQKMGPEFFDQSQMIGLELFFAKRIIERQHGSIHWDLPPDGHTRIRIRMPLHPYWVEAHQEAIRDRADRVGVPTYIERRQRQRSIHFMDRRASERRIYRRPAHFPERRKTAPASASS